MFHIRKALTKAEKEEYRRWQEKHRSQIRQEILNPTKAEREASAASFWSKQAKQQEIMMRGTPTVDELSRPAAIDDRDYGFTPVFESEEEQVKWEAREAAAKAEIELKKRRTAPVYNKGGNQYWSEGMLEDLKTGAHRRRP